MLMASTKELPKTFRLPSAKEKPWGRKEHCLLTLNDPMAIHADAVPGSLLTRRVLQALSLRGAESRSSLIQGVYVYNPREESLESQ